jgi:1,4-dihydroxy-6-naphthoate synthase
MTSAYLALRLYQPDFVPVVTPFDKIDESVQRGDVDAGLLIHEGQLTYKDDGLHLIADMGAWWKQKTGLPLPLGGNVNRKDMPRNLQPKVSRHLRDSIALGLQQRKNALDHAMRFARGLDRSKADEFVGMYVNDWTLDYGDQGRKAISLFLDEGVKSGVITRPVTVEFVDD